MLRRHLRYPLRYKGMGADDRIRTCSVLSTKEVRCPYEHRQQNMVREVGFEPTTFWLQTRPSTKLTYSLKLIREHLPDSNVIGVNSPATTL